MADSKHHREAQVCTSKLEVDMLMVNNTIRRSYVSEIVRVVSLERVEKPHSVPLFVSH